jgi:hypothetical protein
MKWALSGDSAQFDAGLCASRDGSRNRFVRLLIRAGPLSGALNGRRESRGFRRTLAARDVESEAPSSGNGLRQLTQSRRQHPAPEDSTIAIHLNDN